MWTFRRILLGGTDLSTLPDCQKIFYTANSKISIAPNATDAVPLLHNWDESSGKGVIIFDREITKIESEAFAYKQDLVDIVLPSKVTSIGYSAFKDCRNLININIPESVTSIESDAFVYCNNLSSVHITNLSGWFNIDFGSPTANPLYYDCSLYVNEERIEQLVIPEDVTIIKRYTFTHCSGITSIVINDNLQQCNSKSFLDCTSLLDIRVNSLEKWCSIKFADAGSNPLTSATNLYVGDELITNLILPNNVNSINAYTFYNYKNLTSLTIPNSTTVIGNYAFYGCENLTSVEIPDSVTTLGNYAFNSCKSLQSIHIGANVTGITHDTFACDPNIVSRITVAEANTSYDSRNDCNAIIQTKNNRLLHGCASTIIPDTVVEIGAMAFEGCVNLTTIFVPSNVTTCGLGAFKGCTSLTSVHISDLSAWCKTTFRYDNGVNIAASSNPLYLARSLYLNDEKVVNLIIPDDVTQISEGAFAGCNMESVVFHDNISEIGEAAFYDCGKLTRVDIPDSVVEIGNYGFASCSLISEVSIGNGVTDLNMGVLSDNHNLQTVYCKPVTPPYAAYPFVLGYYAPSYPKNLKIYVPRESVSAYRSFMSNNPDWYEYYRNLIYAYDFA